MSAGVSPLIAPLLVDGAAGGGAIAVSAGRTRVTYAELRRDILAIRDDLRRAGIVAGDRVAICLRKSIASLELILGVLAAGAAYVPLNHRLPLVQLGRIAADLRPRLLIAGREVATALASAAPVLSGLRVAVCDPGAGPRIEDVTTFPGGVARAESPADLAAILYTSGSTGEPKGIMLSQRNMTSFVDWAAETFRITADDRVASHAPFHFDISVFDIFCTLGRGGTLHLLDETATLFPGAVRSLVEEAGITVWYSVPTALVRMQERQALRGLRSPRLILFAGEVFPVAALRQVMTDLPQPDYVNLYGPTETNVCTWYRLPGPPACDQDAVPIGQACDHCEVTLRGADGAPVAPGDSGEICVAGPAVMLGYWHRQAMTAATRLEGQADTYRTGDYGRLRNDGMIMFLGRRDQQVKIRGHRIELLALEAVLNRHPAVREAVAVMATGPAGGQLVAYVTTKDRHPDLAALRAFVGAELPSYYVPDRIEWLPDLPRSANGKADRATLQAGARHADLTRQDEATRCRP